MRRIPHIQWPPLLVTLALVLIASAYLTFCADRADAGEVKNPTIRVVTANVKVSVGRQGALHDFRLATRTSHIVVSQENTHRRVANFVGPAWAVFQPKRGVPWDCEENAVLWRKDRFERIRPPRVVRLRHLHIDAPHIQRCLSIVILRDRITHKRVAIVGGHMIPHVEVAGHPRNLPRVYRVFKPSMYHTAEVVDALADRWDNVVIGEDWNVNYWKDRLVRWRGFPHARLTHVGFKTGCNDVAASHGGGRLIDTIYWHHARCVGGHTIGRTASDHNFTQRGIKLLN